MAENFHADFYITCATVIPVLFLASAVQGQALVLLVQRAGRGTARQREHVLLRFFKFRVAAIVIAGFVGEPIALWVLYWESERPWQRSTVFAATLILLAAVAAVPIKTYTDRAANFLGLTPEGLPKAAGGQRGEPPQGTGGDGGQDSA
jgi:hypothetical protein